MTSVNTLLANVSEKMDFQAKTTTTAKGGQTLHLVFVGVGSVNVQRHPRAQP